MAKLPPEPIKDEIVRLLINTHTDTIPNWTTAELEKAYLALYSLAFYWFRLDIEKELK